jgi:hypothetical protein
MLVRLHVGIFQVRNRLDAAASLIGVPLLMFTRYNRPSWGTGLFIGLACVVAGAGGIEMFLEGKKVKKVEGIIWRPEQIKMAQDEEAARLANENEKSQEEDGIERKDMKNIIATSSTSGT